ncbi:LysM peptidoglycan-binding domain-containing protein [Cellulomonas sp. URHD0024]|uniref:CIS tube protein n=1 Tax=Cellulomonas sp. URHD0024 TaxID=1302620 RepID=UPI0004209001|nr:LysM peptidoglycan-binding domain-containing protein [Cellulomonas sp. URHD0024]
MSGAERAMAVLAEQDNPGKRLEFHFNPTTISFSRAVTWNRSPKKTTDPPVQFTGAGPTSITVQIFLDAVGKDRPKGVQPEIDQLLGWTTVPDVTKPSSGPPPLVFAWGVLSVSTEKSFVGYLESLKVTVEMFDRNGCPLRATADVALKSAAQEPKGTNPTSGAERSRRRHTLRSGQTLHSVAYDHYGDPGAWRAIAELNGIDNPMRLGPGRELLLPDVSELARVVR